MLRRDNLTRKLVGEMLKIASPVIEFGSTSMGIVETDIGPVAIGKRSIPGTESKLFHILELLGPVLIKEAAEIGEASWMLECLLARAEWMGVSKRIEAVVVDSRIVFGLFAEGLIIDNYLDQVINGYAEGRVILNGRVYKLLASATSGVLGLGNNSVIVDRNRVPVP